jgi:hypothetical protein
MRWRGISQFSLSLFSRSLSLSLARLSAQLEDELMGKERLQAGTNSQKITLYIDFYMVNALGH